MAVQGSSDFLVPFTVAGTIGVAAGVLRFVTPFAARLIGVAAGINTAPTGADLTMDVNINGTTVFTDQTKRAKILATKSSGVTALATPAALAVGDYLTVDVDVVGSGVAGANLDVTLWLEKA